MLIISIFDIINLWLFKYGLLNYAAKTLFHPILTVRFCDITKRVQCTLKMTNFSKKYGRHTDITKTHLHVFLKCFKMRLGFLKAFFMHLSSDYENISKWRPESDNQGCQNA